MHLDDGTVERQGFDLDPDDLLVLQGRKDTIQHTCLGPAIHSGVDRMPVTETQRQPPPFAAVFGHIQDRVKHFEIGDAHIAALMRKASLYPTILGLGRLTRWTSRVLGSSSLLLLVLPVNGVSQAWVQPERSEANLDALARVELRTYQMPQADNVEVEYGVYVPTSYEADQANPLVIALHGPGSGTMYMMEYNNLVELAEDYGFIVATPLGYHPRGWYGSRGPGNEFNRSREDPGPGNLGELSEADVINVLGIMREEYDVDEGRIYLIGQSMGGGGTWYLGTKYPELWAALVPMAPAISSSPDVLRAARDTPVMVVMGDADESVDVEVTRQWVAKMEELGMNYEYIEVPGGSHSSAERENIDKVFEFLDKHSK